MSKLIVAASMRERLAPLTTLTMSSRELATRYEQPVIEARRERRKGDDPGEPTPEMRMMQQRSNGVLIELSQQKVIRAVYSERQLQEVLVDFWFNHFNVDARKGPDRFMLTAYERDVIRPHVFGKFKDLLVATAKSPAMLFYLDNWQSVGPHSQLAVFGPGNQRRQFRRGPFGMIYQVPPRPQANKNRPSGLNENYAREIMELHTLGVDGSYTQKDVTELAKVLAGWSIDQPQLGGGFRFNERAHEPGAKHIL